MWFDSPDVCGGFENVVLGVLLCYVFHLLLVATTTEIVHPHKLVHFTTQSARRHFHLCLCMPLYTFRWPADLTFFFFFFFCCFSPPIHFVPSSFFLLFVIIFFLTIDVPVNSRQIGAQVAGLATARHPPYIQRESTTAAAATTSRRSVSLNYENKRQRSFIFARLIIDKTKRTESFFPLYLKTK